MGGGEKGGWNILATESANHCACIEGPVAYLKEIMVGLGGEVEELHVGSWEKKKEEMLRKRKAILPPSCSPAQACRSKSTGFNHTYLQQSSCTSCIIKGS